MLSATFVEDEAAVWRHARAGPPHPSTTPRAVSGECSRGPREEGGNPAYLAWRALDGRLADATPAAGRVAGVVLAAAALYQLSPLKSACLRRCRSPLSFFMLHGNHLDRPSGAIVAGARHGLLCLGCCWMLMGVLVAFGTMQLWWMAALATLILLEKTTRVGERVAMAAGVGFAVLGALLLVHPTTISQLI